MESQASRALSQCILMVAIFLVVCAATGKGAISGTELRAISGINAKGPYVGVVVPNAYEMNPLLESSSFVPHPSLPRLDILGRRFRIGKVGNTKVIVVMTGLSMLNAGVTTQLLLTLFNVKGVVHYGIAGNANPNFQIGDVTIPKYWAHTSLWNWQRFGDDADDKLAFETDGDYMRSIGHLNFSDYSNSSKANLLNSIWYQPEEVFPVTGTPEIRQHAFWVPVSEKYLKLAKNLKDTKLEKCVNATTCLPRSPIVQTVNRGISANILLDNGAYRQFLYSKFNATPVDMETAAVALICLQQKKEFIAFRAVSDLAGGGSAISNEAAIFATLAAKNSVDISIQFIKLLS